MYRIVEYGITQRPLLYLACQEHATRLCEMQGIRTAQVALGHANISTTQRYDHPNEDEGEKESGFVLSILLLYLLISLPFQKTINYLFTCHFEYYYVPPIIRAIAKTPIF